MYNRLGQYRKALCYHNQALTVRKKLGDRQGIAGSFNNLGNVYANLGQFYKSLDCYKRALAIDQKLGNPEIITTSFNNLGYVYYNMGQFENGQVFFDKAIQQFESISEQISDPDQVGALQDTLNLYTNYAALRLRQQQPSKALALLERKLAQGLARHLAQSRVDYGATFNLEDAARWEKAKTERATVENLLGSAENRFARATEQANRVNKDINVTPQCKADATAEVKAALKQRDGAKQRDETSERQLSVVRNEMRQRYPQFAAVNRPRPPTSAQLADLARRNPDTLYLQWAVAEDETLLLALGQKDGVKGFSIPIKSNKLAQKVQAWRNSIWAGYNRGDSNSAEENIRYAKKAGNEPFHAWALYQTLFAPLAKAGLLAPNRYHRLVLVGDGPLLDLPFAALVTDIGAGGKPASGREPRLLDFYTVSNAVSFGVLDWPTSGGKADLPLLCIADTAADTRPERFGGDFAASVTLPSPTVRRGNAATLTMRAGYGSLSEARKEGKDIAGMIPGAVGLAGPLAREAVVREEMVHADILHFAVHNVLDNQNALRSWLLLAEEDENSAFDGRLEAREVANMKLKARMAVLSACESGRGKRRGGDGLIGMAWAFRGAGCPCVVASQWKVEDRASHSLMVYFYRSLLEGCRKDEALQQAMQAVRREQGHQAPFWWAGFEVIGDTTPMFAKPALHCVLRPRLHCGLFNINQPLRAA